MLVVGTMRYGTVSGLGHSWALGLLQCQAEQNLNLGLGGFLDPDA